MSLQDTILCEESLNVSSNNIRNTRNQPLKHPNKVIRRLSKRGHV